jgi:hypothetical protein
MCPIIHKTTRRYLRWDRNALILQTVNITGNMARSRMDFSWCSTENAKNATARNCSAVR